MDAERTKTKPDLASSVSRRRTAALAAGVAAATLFLLLATESQIGLTWDEPDYIVAAESYAAWLGALARDPGRALSREAIDAHWSANRNHPPLSKAWSGVVWALSGGLRRRGLLSDLATRRLGNILLNSIGVGLLFLLVEDVYGPWTGLAASAALLAMPRVFFHLHLTALEGPAAALSVATVLLFWKTRQRGAWWIDVVLGIVWGLAVSAKANAVLVYPALMIWALIAGRARAQCPVLARRRVLVRLAIMGAVAVGVFFCCWPWLYHDTLARVKHYVVWTTVGHWQFGQWYLGRFTMPPPWYFPFVMAAVAVPPGILACFLLGSGRALARREERALGGLLLLNALVPMLALATGLCMVYDNDRLFVPAMPFVAALAAIGLHTLAEGIRAVIAAAPRVRCGAHALAVAALAGLVFVPPLVAAAQLYPHLLSYYCGLVGGVGGATRLGFETTYWCETYNATLEYLNRHAQAGDVVWVDPWSHNVMIYYQRVGRLRDDLRLAGWGEIPSLFDPQIVTVNAGYDEADWVVFQHRQTAFGEQGRAHPLVRWMQERSPEFELRFDGVPLVSVYSPGASGHP